MKTMFTMGFDQSYFGSSSPQLFLGQNIDLDKLRGDMSRTEDKMAVINRWMENRPDYETILGADLSRWNSLMNTAASYATDATNVEQRIGSNDPSAWQISSTERDSVNNWMSAINQLYLLTMSHPQLRLGPGAPTVSPSGALTKVPGPQPSTGPSPVVIGVGAAAVIGILALALT